MAQTMARSIRPSRSEGRVEFGSTRLDSSRLCAWANNVVRLRPFGTV
jgi:hypothetical protein